MTVQNQLAAAEKFGEEHQALGSQQSLVADEKQDRALSEDDIWSRKNLRWRDGRPIADMANALRIFERHEDFKGRYRYNEMVNRVLDKGVVMIDWRIAEVCVTIQERFIPAIDEAIVLKGLTIAAYKTGVNK